MHFALTGATLHDGASVSADRAVIIADGRIKAVIDVRAVPAGMARTDLGGGILAPGFIDVQVNGGGGGLMNDDPNVAVVARIAESHRRFGTTGLLPTVITDDPAVTAAAVRAVRDARAQAVPGVLGIHIEGPFIDVRRQGAHPPEFIRLPGEADFALVAAADCGTILMTVAPSTVEPATIRRLADLGVVVSLGHAEASAEQALAALAAGARGFTHLFNAMSQLNHRAPGMVGAALVDADSFCGIIADGFHVHPVALKVAIAAKRRGRIVLVTDAMPTAAGGPDRFILNGREVVRADGQLTLADGTLAGSDLTMDAAVRYAIDHLGVARDEALRMASLYPAGFIGLDHAYGRIAPGYAADLVHLTDDLRVTGTWIGGDYAAGAV